MKLDEARVQEEVLRAAQLLTARVASLEAELRLEKEKHDVTQAHLQECQTDLAMARRRLTITKPSAHKMSIDRRDSVSSVTASSTPKPRDPHHVCI